MTCIIALTEKNVIHMASDKIASRAFSQFEMKYSKIFKNNGYLIGAAGLSRVADLIRYLKIPRFKHGDYLRFVVKNIIPTLRKELIENNCVRPDDGDSSSHEKAAETMDSEILIGMSGGKLIHIGSDFSALVCKQNYNVIGCAVPLALGAMHVIQNSSQLNSLSPRGKLHLAMKAVEAHEMGVKGFKYLSM